MRNSNLGPLDKNVALNGATGFLPCRSRGSWLRGPRYLGHMKDGAHPTPFAGFKGVTDDNFEI